MSYSRSIYAKRNTQFPSIVRELASMASVNILEQSKANQVGEHT